MLNLPKLLSGIKKVKLITNAILMTAVLTIISLIITDIISITFETRIESNENTVTIIMICWVLWALQSKRYQKGEG